MTGILTESVERYASGLKRYIALQSEDMLVQSFAIGRTGIEGHFHLVDIATTHHSVVEELLMRTSSVAERAQIIHASRDFLLECLGPFEMALRGFRDSNTALQLLNRELEDRVAKRTANLAEANAQLLREIDHRRHSEMSLAQHADRLHVLRSIDQAVVAAHSQVEIAEVVFDQLQELVPSERMSITQYNVQADHGVLLGVRTRFWSRVPKGATFSLANFLGNNPKFAHGEPVLIRNLAADVSSLSGALETLFEEGIRSYLSVPLVARDVLMGALNLGRAAVDGFSETDIEIAKEVSTQLAIGLENMRLLETERRRNTELEALHDASLKITARLELQPVLQTISEYALTVVDADDAQIFLYDGETLTFGASSLRSDSARAPHTHLHPGGLTVQVARTGERVSIGNVDTHPLYAGRGWGGSIISIPLVVGEQVHGVMNLSFDKPHGFGENEVRFLDLLSDQAAIALHNAKLYEQLHRYTDDLEQRVNERTKQLYHINEQISAFFKSSADAIAVCDAHGRILQFNPAFSQLCGIEAPQGDLYTALRVTDRQVLAEAIREVSGSEQSIRTELTLLGSTDSLLNFDLTLVPLSNDSPLEARIMCTLHDVTDRKRLEGELRNALEREREIRELKSRFTSMVSHEFRTPLAVIQSSSDLLSRYAHRLTEQRRGEQLVEIQTQVRNLTLLLDDVLTISRAESVGVDFNPAPLDLVALCRAITGEIQGMTLKHDIRFSAQAGCSEVRADTKLLQQALRNLLTNAIKYSPDGGTITLDVTCDDTILTIRVTDHGIGIPEADKKYLFEAFHRAKNVGTISGTGLGLSIVQQAIDLHGGKVEVESTLGVGTTFILKLPRARP